MTKALVKYQYYAYVILCNNGTLYKGQTNNLERRMKQHFTGEGALWTKTYKPVRLVYYKAFDTRKEACIQEKRWKQGANNLRKKLRKRGLI